MTFSVIKYRSAWYALSGITIGLSIAFLSLWGLRQGLEFTGGSLLAVRFTQRPTVVEAERALADAQADLGTIIIQPVGDTDMQFRLKNVSEEQHQKSMEALKKAFGEVTELRFDTIGPVIGEELRQKSIQGLVLVLVGIMIYVAYAFRKVSAPIQSWKYGIVTIFTAFHDVIIPIGVFAWLGHYYGVEIGTAFIAAILTILGYSITDTIVVLDRVRENLQKRSGTFAELVDLSVRQTYLRSFNTSMTTLLTLSAIHFFGGQSLKDFTLTLMIGIAGGTYSSIFIASPLLVTWNNLSKRK